MKKIYNKPLVAIERFTLTERISSCDAKMNLVSVNSCDVIDDALAEGIKMWEMLGLFTTSCQNEIQPGPISGSAFCYHTAQSQDLAQIFNS